MRALAWTCLVLLPVMLGCKPKSETGGALRPAAPADAAETGDQPAKVPQVDVQIADKDWDGTVEAKVGQTIGISLPENPTTGYKWQFAWEPKELLEQVEDSFQAPPPDGPIGAGGTRHLVLKAKRAGEARLRAQYGQPWEGGLTEKPRTVTIMVTEAEEDGPAPEGKTLPAKPGETVKATVGDRIEIKLAANPTTGYQWRCTWEPKEALEMVEDKYTPDEAPGRVGAGGTQLYRLRTLKPGDAKITVQYGRWWEGGEKEKPQTVELQVAPKPEE